MVISNTTVILYLLKARRVDLLQNVYSHVIIPPEVYAELTVKGEEYAQEVEGCKRLVERKFLIVKTVERIQHFGLDKGENAALSLCKEQKEQEFLSDDNGARKAARLQGFQVKGTLGILLLNLEKGGITRGEFFGILDTLINSGFYLSPEVYSALHKKVQEAQEK